MHKLAEALEARKGEDSLRTVASQIGVAPGTVEGWLKGWRQPNYKHLRPLAEYLNEDIDMIIRWLVEEEVTSTSRKGVSRSSNGLVPAFAA